SKSVGFVAIGRNEGERLRRCLRAIPRSYGRTVYVDSGSVDDSIALARGLGAEVVELDASVPFTAARARNAGIARLLEAPGGAAAKSHPSAAAASGGDPIDFLLVL